MKFVLAEEVIIFSEGILFYLCFFAWFGDNSHSVWELDADVKVEPS